MELESFCPTCNINFKIANIKFSQHQKKLLDLLKVSCNTGSKKVSINSDYELYIQHKIKCCGNSVDQPNTSLTEIFHLTDNSEIPRDIEDATLHVTRKKVANSSNNSIEFKSGGPWARFFFHLLKLSTQSTSCHVPFFAPRKYQKTRVFLIFVGCKKEIIFLK